MKVKDWKPFGCEVNLLLGLLETWMFQVDWWQDIGESGPWISYHPYRKSYNTWYVSKAKAIELKYKGPQLDEHNG